MEQMEDQARTIVISGYYGFGNSGDEAVLQSMLAALQQASQQSGIRLEPIVLSSRPQWTERMYGVRAVHRMKPGKIIEAIRQSEGLISGGGSLLQDATGLKTIPYYLGIIQLAQWMHKPVFIYSQGIGPIHRRIFHPFIRTLFHKSAYVSVRDDESKALLTKIGVHEQEVEVVPDPVMGFLPLQLSEQISSAGELPLIGVSVRFWRQDRSELEGLAQALGTIAAHMPARIRFLPFHQPEDTEASRFVMERLPAEALKHAHIVTDVESPLAMIGQVAECQLLIGMRLHALIYSATQSVPLVGISYDPKIDRFLNRLEMRPAANTDRFDVQSVARQSLQLLSESGRWKREKADLIAAMRQKSHTPAQQIIRLLRT